MEVEKRYRNVRVTAAKPADSQDGKITVSCYKGNPEKETSMIRPKRNGFNFPALLLTVLLAIPAVAFAAEPAAQKPCADEIEKFCKDARPGEGRIVQCLRDHDGELSAVCRDKVKKVVQRLEEAKQICANDIEKFCADVTPGGGRLIKCLKPHLQELAPACREQLQSVQARTGGGKKPVQ